MSIDLLIRMVKSSLRFWFGINYILQVITVSWFPLSAANTLSLVRERSVQSNPPQSLLLLVVCMCARRKKKKKIVWTVISKYQPHSTGGRRSDTIATADLADLLVFKLIEIVFLSNDKRCKKFSIIHLFICIWFAVVEWVRRINRLRIRIVNQKKNRIRIIKKESKETPVQLCSSSVVRWFDSRDQNG